ncbi:hypothetical protein GALMADRAFT_1311360 [Galerina marginata CBS 339.88]|uniref:DUF6533 domain-containing protein n=1 Tax=Galerina marginata (strain CBS 339.88) TaxID=685588 RepID=A0A067TH25_GALM3|nr:hypothetical protein GALMADRAFT_1311360 [Galerina marginata CBS 339.88]
MVVAPLDFQNALVTHFWYERLDICLYLASSTLLTHDYICTVGSEIKYVWSSPWSIGLILFYINRYLPFVYFILISFGKVSLMTVRECIWVTPLTLWTVTASLLASQAVVILRTYAIWGCRRLIFYVLAAWVIIFPGSLIVLVAKATASIPKTSKALTVFNNRKLNCSIVPVDVGDVIIVLVHYLMTFLGEFAIVTLTAIKAHEHVRNTSCSWIDQLYRNGIFQCGCILLLSLLNLFMAYVAPNELKTSILPLQCTFHSIFCSRVVFLLFKNRTIRGQRDGPVTNSGSSAIFTTVPLQTTDSQERAYIEWV